MYCGNITCSLIWNALTVNDSLQYDSHHDKDSYIYMHPVNNISFSNMEMK